MKACILFTAGILIAERTEPRTAAVLVALGISAVACILLSRYDIPGALSASAVMICAGMTAFSGSTELHSPVILPPELIDSRIEATGTVVGPCRYSRGHTTWTLACSGIAVGDSSYANNAATGEIACTFFDRQVSLDEGAKMTVGGKLRRLRHVLTRRDFLSGAAPDMTELRIIVDSLTHANGSRKPVSFYAGAERTVSRLIDRYPYGGHRDILKAMVIGERSGIPFETGKLYAQTGIAHILAVSGLHVGILVMVVTFLLRRLRWSKTTRFFATVLIMFFYAGICGFRPPVSRAVIMFTLLTGASLAERPKNVENSLFAAIIIILAFDPRALFSASLQLSFAAVWTITTFYKPLYDFTGGNKHRTWLARYSLSVGIVSLLATAGTAPVTAAHFGSLPVYGIPANLAAVPLTFIIVTLGMLSIAATVPGVLTAPIAHFLSFLTGLLLSCLNLIASFIASLPYSSIAVDSISLFAGTCLVLWLYLLSRSRGRPLFRKLLLYIPLVFLLVTAWNPAIDSVRAADSRSIFFDVGQGDAALITLRETHTILVDTGPGYSGRSAAESYIVPCLKNAGISRIDGVIISHPHTDHMGGLDAIVRSIDVGRIFCSPALGDSLASLYGDRVTVLGAGDSVAVGNDGMLVLSPGPLNLTRETREEVFGNNGSLVVRIDVSGRRILFTGDIENPIQLQAAAWGAALGADILKTPHHGAGGMSEAFIRAVHPSVAVISCGAGNRYGHPAQSTMHMLEREGSTVMRTDRRGSIVIRLPDIAISSR